MPISAGTKLGPYEILTSIGAGGMGEVYRAHDPRLGRDVAVKVSALQFTDRFEREARAIAALNHPNICQVYDIGPNYLVMEFIEGAPLAGPLPLDVALRHAVQIADALSAAHAKGITHRDLKPANILVTASGIKLLDFGLALLSPGLASDETATVGLTQAGTILGTAAYMSPEQAEAKPVDARSDIFSFGTVLYEMLSGRRAFTGDSAIAILAAVLNKEPERLDTAPALQSIVTRCLCKSPADRFQSLTEVKEALLAVAGSGSWPGAAVSGALTALPAQSSSVERPPSIAVLPFVSLSRDEDNEYFSDGLAEEIINVLARIPGLKVIARTSAFAFRGKELDVRKIAEMLGVRSILEGSVRRSGSRIRVTAQLISADDGSHLWSDRYDRELADVFALQDEIAGAIATALTTKLTVRAEVSRQHTPKVAAYEAVLKARYHLNKVTPESMVRARECLEQAIAIDPEYALPHSVLGGCFVSPAIYGMLPAHQAMPLARAEYQKALEIDPMLPEALVGLAAISMLYDYNWKEAERLFGMAMTRGPLPVGARMRYGHYLFCTGRPEAALKEHETAVQGDPLNLQLRSILALARMIAGRDADAAGECRRILELDENYHLGHFYLSLALLQLGKIEEALASAEKAYALAPWARSGAGYIAGLRKLTGDTGRAEAALETLGDGTAPGAPLGFVHYHLVGSEIEQAAGWAGKAIEQREPAVIYFLLLPLAKDLRRSSRWPALAKMVNLPHPGFSIER
ncbi:MAG TPA: protein kinase [Bryobacteraceae bacterium]|nr:protein kinase [Bryobacteraceae bacterium]